jgi:hypothetical protein
MNEKIQRAGDIPAAYLGESLLMMSIEQGQYFSLNGVGARIWELLEDPTTQPALVELLVGEYEVPEDLCAAQVGNFLAGLRQRGLLADFS